MKGDTDRALISYDSARVTIEARLEAAPDDARYYSALGIALAGLGRDEEAIQHARDGLRMMPPEKEAWRGTYRLRDLALVYAMTDRADEAIDLLERLLSIPADFSVWDLRLDPYWDPLRGNPRFEALVAD